MRARVQKRRGGHPVSWEETRGAPIPGGCGRSDRSPCTGRLQQWRSRQHDDPSSAAFHKPSGSDDDISPSHDHLDRERLPTSRKTSSAPPSTCSLMSTPA